MPIPAADGDFFPIFFYRAFRPANAFPTNSERLASQDLQAPKIFEPGESAGDTRPSSPLAHVRCADIFPILFSQGARAPRQARRDTRDRCDPLRPVIRRDAPMLIQHKSPSPLVLSRFSLSVGLFFISLTMVFPYI